MRSYGVALALVVLPLLIFIGLPLTASAVSYPPAPLYHRLGQAETAMSAGDVVYLFHSGTDEIKSAIHADDILTVFRISPSCEVREAGKVRVISQIDETYVKGVVMEGVVKPNDIAKKGNISLLLISAETCRHEIK